MSKLGDHIEYVKGFAFKSKDYTETGIPVIRVSNFTDNSIDIKDVYHIPKERFSEFQKVNLIKDDIVIATVGSWPTNPSSVVGKTIRVPPEANNTLLNQNAVRIRSLDKDEQLYFYYVLKDKSFSDYIISTAQGSANQASITLKSILDYDLPNIDSKEKRIKIGKTLATYDEKIQLNTQINQTLEQIAQALFKSWFVDFDPVRAKVQALSDGLNLEQAELAAMQAISGKTPEELTALSQTQPNRYAELAETAKAFPCEMVEVDGVEVPKGWEQTTLSEICEMQNGYAFKSSEWTDAGIPVIKIGSIQSKILIVEGNGFVSEDNLSLRSNFVLNDGDIVIGLTGAYVGKVGRMPANKKAMLNQRVAKFLAKRINESETFYSFIYMNIIQEDFKNFVDFTAQGSAQPNISTRDILKYPLLLANTEVHLVFEKLLKKTLDKSIFNSYQNEILSNSRDLLLPRLLGGENYE